MATLRGIAFEARGVVLDWTSSDTRAPRKGFSSPPHPSPRRPEVFFPASVASGQNHPRVRSTASVAFGRVANRADHAQRLSAPVSTDSFRDCRDSSSATSTTRATSHAPPCPPPPPLSPGARPSVARPSRPPSGARARRRALQAQDQRARARLPRGSRRPGAPQRGDGRGGVRALQQDRRSRRRHGFPPKVRDPRVRSRHRTTPTRAVYPFTRDPSDPRPLPRRDRASSATHLVYSPGRARRDLDHPRDRSPSPRDRSSPKTPPSILNPRVAPSPLFPSLRLWFAAATA